MTPFFIASEHDLNLVQEPFALKENNAGIDDSEIDLLMLCNLESILTGSDWESVFDKVYINPVRDHGPDGPWIYQVSEKLLDALRKLTPEALLNCANKWAETDEWTLRQDSPERIADVLHFLSALARQASSEGKSLFILTRI